MIRQSDQVVSYNETDTATLQKIVVSLLAAFLMQEESNAK
jgi:hypothetical protein